MKPISKSLILSMAVGGILWGCTPEFVQPKTAQETQNGPQLLTLPPICSFVDSMQLQSTDGSFIVNNLPGSTAPWGNVEVYNTDAGLLINIRVASSQVIDITRSRIDLGNNYSFDLNGFPVITSDFVVFNNLPNPNSYQIYIQRDSIQMDMSDCFAISLNLTIARQSFLGAIFPSSIRSVWAYNDGGNNAAGSQVPESPYVLPFCWRECPLPPFRDSVEVCEKVLVGNPGLNSCASLQPDNSGAFGTLTYAWSTGSTGPAISVCPTTTSSYRVSVYENGRPFRISKFTVNAVDVSCSAGNSQQHKVVVCHRPPGNPANTQEICIDFQGVPAHVAAYRAGNANPNQGHDSGCTIGQCGLNPCN